MSARRQSPAQPGRATAARGESGAAVRPARLEATASRLHQTAVEVLRRVRVEERRHGIGAAQWSALAVLVAAGETRLGSLALAEGVKPPTMSRIVDGLEQAGLAQRLRSTSDRRSVSIRATSRGRRLVTEGHARRVGAIARYLGSLSAAEVDILETALDSLQAIPPAPR